METDLMLIVGVFLLGCAVGAFVWMQIDKRFRRDLDVLNRRIDEAKEILRTRSVSPEFRANLAKVMDEHDETLRRLAKGPE